MTTRAATSTPLERRLDAMCDVVDLSANSRQSKARRRARTTQLWASCYLNTHEIRADLDNPVMKRPVDLVGDNNFHGDSIHDAFVSIDPVALSADIQAAAASRRELSMAQAVDALSDLDDLLSWAHAVRAELVVAAAGEQPVPLAATQTVDGRSVRDAKACQMGAALDLSANAAMGLADMSRNLVVWLPRTLELMRRGVASHQKARIISDGANTLFAHLDHTIDVDAIAIAMNRYERIVTRRISATSLSELRKAVAHAISIVAPVSVEENHTAAKADRRVELFDIGSGMSLLQAYLPSLEAARVWKVLEHTARTEGVEGTSHAARMADALVRIVDGSSEITPERRNSAAVVQVVVGLATLMGASNAVGEVQGAGGWLTPDTVRELAQSSPLRRLIVDDATGELLEFGRKTYRPPTSLKNHVVARDRVCRAPGCNRDATFADVDHIVPWDSGGGTDVGNLACLCRRHHLLKTFGGWNYELAPDGQAKWSLPDGITAVDPPKASLHLWDDLPPF